MENMKSQSLYVQTSTNTSQRTMIKKMLNLKCRSCTTPAEAVPTSEVEEQSAIPASKESPVPAEFISEINERPDVHDGQNLISVSHQVEEAADQLQITTNLAEPPDSSQVTVMVETVSEDHYIDRTPIIQVIEMEPYNDADMDQEEQWSTEDAILVELDEDEISSIIAEVDSIDSSGLSVIDEEPEAELEHQMENEQEGDVCDIDDSLSTKTTAMKEHKTLQPETQQENTEEAMKLHIKDFQVPDINESQTAIVQEMIIRKRGIPELVNVTDQDSDSGSFRPLQLTTLSENDTTKTGETEEPLYDEGITENIEELVEDVLDIPCKDENSDKFERNSVNETTTTQTEGHKIPESEVLVEEVPVEELIASSKTDQTECATEIPPELPQLDTVTEDKINSGATDEIAQTEGQIPHEHPTEGKPSLVHAEEIDDSECQSTVQDMPFEDECSRSQPIDVDTERHEAVSSMEIELEVVQPDKRSTPPFLRDQSQTTETNNDLIVVEISNQPGDNLEKIEVDDIIEPVEGVVAYVDTPLLQSQITPGASTASIPEYIDKEDNGDKEQPKEEAQLTVPFGEEISSDKANNIMTVKTLDIDEQDSADIPVTLEYDNIDQNIASTTVTMDSTDHYRVSILTTSVKDDSDTVSGVSSQRRCEDTGKADMVYQRCHDQKPNDEIRDQKMGKETQDLHYNGMYDKSMHVAQLFVEVPEPSPELAPEISVVNEKMSQSQEHPYDTSIIDNIAIDEPDQPSSVYEDKSIDITDIPTDTETSLVTQTDTEEEWKGTDKPKTSEPAVAQQSTDVPDTKTHEENLPMDSESKADYQEVTQAVTTIGSIRRYNIPEAEWPVQHSVMPKRICPAAEIIEQGENIQDLVQQAASSIPEKILGTETEVTSDIMEVNIQDNCDKEEGEIMTDEIAAVPENYVPKPIITQAGDMEHAAERAELEKTDIGTTEEILKMPKSTPGPVTSDGKSAKIQDMMLKESEESIIEEEPEHLPHISYETKEETSPTESTVQWSSSKIKSPSEERSEAGITLHRLQRKDTKEDLFPMSGKEEIPAPSETESAQIENKTEKPDKQLTAVHQEKENDQCEDTTVDSVPSVQADILESRKAEIFSMPPFGERVYSVTSSMMPQIKILQPDLAHKDVHSASPDHSVTPVSSLSDISEAASPPPEEAIIESTTAIDVAVQPPELSSSNITTQKIQSEFGVCFSETVTEYMASENIQKEQVHLEDTLSQQVDGLEDVTTEKMEIPPEVQADHDVTTITESLVLNESASQQENSIIQGNDMQPNQSIQVKIDHEMQDTALYITSPSVGSDSRDVLDIDKVKCEDATSFRESADELTTAVPMEYNTSNASEGTELTTAEFTVIDITQSDGEVPVNDFELGSEPAESSSEADVLPKNKEQPQQEDIKQFEYPEHVFGIPANEELENVKAPAPNRQADSTAIDMESNKEKPSCISDIKSDKNFDEKVKKEHLEDIKTDMYLLKKGGGSQDPPSVSTEIQPSSDVICHPLMKEENNEQTEQTDVLPTSQNRHLHIVDDHRHENDDMEGITASEYVENGTEDVHISDSSNDKVEEIPNIDGSEVYDVQSPSVKSASVTVFRAPSMTTYVISRSDESDGESSSSEAKDGSYGESVPFEVGASVTESPKGIGSGLPEEFTVHLHELQKGDIQAIKGEEDTEELITTGGKQQPMQEHSIEIKRYEYPEEVFAPTVKITPEVDDESDREKVADTCYDADNNMERMQPEIVASTIEIMPAEDRLGGIVSEPFAQTDAFMPLEEDDNTGTDDHSLQQEDPASGRAVDEGHIAAKVVAPSDWPEVDSRDKPTDENCFEDALPISDHRQLPSRHQAHVIVYPREDIGIAEKIEPVIALERETTGVSDDSYSDQDVSHIDTETSEVGEESLLEKELISQTSLPSDGQKLVPQENIETHEDEQQSTTNIEPDFRSSDAVPCDVTDTVEQHTEEVIVSGQENMVSHTVPEDAGNQMEQQFPITNVVENKKDEVYNVSSPADTTASVTVHRTPTVTTYVISRSDDDSDEDNTSLTEDENKLFDETLPETTILPESATHSTESQLDNLHEVKDSIRKLTLERPSDIDENVDASATPVSSLDIQLGEIKTFEYLEESVSTTDFIKVISGIETDHDMHEEAFVTREARDTSPKLDVPEPSSLPSSYQTMDMEMLEYTESSVSPIHIFEGSEVSELDTDRQAEKIIIKETEENTPERTISGSIQLVTEDFFPDTENDKEAFNKVNQFEVVGELGAVDQIPQADPEEKQLESVTKIYSREDAVAEVAREHSYPSSTSEIDTETYDVLSPSEHSSSVIVHRSYGITTYVISRSDDDSDEEAMVDHSNDVEVQISARSSEECQEGKKSVDACTNTSPVSVQAVEIATNTDGTCQMQDSKSERGLHSTTETTTTTENAEHKTVSVEAGTNTIIDERAKYSSIEVATNTEDTEKKAPRTTFETGTNTEYDDKPSPSTLEIATNTDEYGKHFVATTDMATNTDIGKYYIEARTDSSTYTEEQVKYENTSLENKQTERPEDGDVAKHMIPGGLDMIGNDKTADYIGPEITMEVLDSPDREVRSIMEEAILPDNVVITNVPMKPKMVSTSTNTDTALTVPTVDRSMSTEPEASLTDQNLRSAGTSPIQLSSEMVDMATATEETKTESVRFTSFDVSTMTDAGQMATASTGTSPVVQLQDVNIGAQADKDGTSIEVDVISDHQGTEKISIGTSPITDFEQAWLSEESEQLEDVYHDEEHFLSNRFVPIVESDTDSVSESASMKSDDVCLPVDGDDATGANADIEAEDIPKGPTDKDLETQPKYATTHQETVEGVVLYTLKKPVECGKRIQEHQETTDLAQTEAESLEDARTVVIDGDSVTIYPEEVYLPPKGSVPISNQPERKTTGTNTDPVSSDTMVMTDADYGYDNILETRQQPATDSPKVSTPEQTVTSVFPTRSSVGTNTVPMATEISTMTDAPSDKQSEPKLDMKPQTITTSINTEPLHADQGIMTEEVDEGRDTSENFEKNKTGEMESHSYEDDKIPDRERQPSEKDDLYMTRSTQVPDEMAQKPSTSCVSVGTQIEPVILYEGIVHTNGNEHTENEPSEESHTLHESPSGLIDIRGTCEIGTMTESFQQIGHAEQGTQFDQISHDFDPHTETVAEQATEFTVSEQGVQVSSNFDTVKTPMRDAQTTTDLTDHTYFMNMESAASDQRSEEDLARHVHFSNDTIIIKDIIDEDLQPEEGEIMHLPEIPEVEETAGEQPEEFAISTIDKLPTEAASDSFDGSLQSTSLDNSLSDTDLAQASALPIEREIGQHDKDQEQAKFKREPCELATHHFVPYSKSRLETAFFDSDYVTEEEHIDAYNKETDTETDADDATQYFMSDAEGGRSDQEASPGHPVRSESNQVTAEDELTALLKSMARSREQTEMVTRRSREILPHQPRVERVQNQQDIDELLESLSRRRRETEAVSQRARDVVSKWKLSSEEDSGGISVSTELKEDKISEELNPTDEEEIPMEGKDVEENNQEDSQVLYQVPRLDELAAKKILYQNLPQPTMEKKDLAEQKSQSPEQRDIVEAVIPEFESTTSVETSISEPVMSAESPPINEAFRQFLENIKKQGTTEASALEQAENMDAEDTNDNVLDKEHSATSGDPTVVTEINPEFIFPVFSDISFDLDDEDDEDLKALKETQQNIDSVMAEISMDDDEQSEDADDLDTTHPELVALMDEVGQDEGELPRGTSEKIFTSTPLEEPITHAGKSIGIQYVHNDDDDDDDDDGDIDVEGYRLRALSVSPVKMDNYDILEDVNVKEAEPKSDIQEESVQSDKKTATTEAKGTSTSPILTHDHSTDTDDMVSPTNIDLNDLLRQMKEEYAKVRGILERSPSPARKPRYQLSSEDIDDANISKESNESDNSEATSPDRDNIRITHRSRIDDIQRRPIRAYDREFNVLRTAEQDHNASIEEERSGSESADSFTMVYLRPGEPVPNVLSQNGDLYRISRLSRPDIISTRSRDTQTHVATRDESSLTDDYLLETISRAENEIDSFQQVCDMMLQTLDDEDRSGATYQGRSPTDTSTQTEDSSREMKDEEVETDIYISNLSLAQLEAMGKDRELLRRWLGLNYDRADLTVQLMEAKLMHGIGETDAILRALEDDFPTTGMASRTRQRVLATRRAEIETFLNEREMVRNETRRTVNVTIERHQRQTHTAGISRQHHVHHTHTTDPLVQPNRHGLGESSGGGHYSDIDLLLSEYRHTRDRSQREIEKARATLKEQTESEKKRMQEELQRLRKVELKRKEFATKAKEEIRIERQKMFLSERSHSSSPTRPRTVSPSPFTHYSVRDRPYSTSADRAVRSATPEGLTSTVGQRRYEAIWTATNSQSPHRYKAADLIGTEKQFLSQYPSFLEKSKDYPSSSHQRSLSSENQRVTPAWRSTERLNEGRQSSFSSSRLGDAPQKWKSTGTLSRTSTRPASPSTGASDWRKGVGRARSVSPQRRVRSSYSPPRPGYVLSPQTSTPSGSRSNSPEGPRRWMDKDGRAYEMYSPRNRSPERTTRTIDTKSNQEGIQPILDAVEQEIHNLRKSYSSQSETGYEDTSSQSFEELYQAMTRRDRERRPHQRYGSYDNGTSAVTSTRQHTRERSVSPSTMRSSSASRSSTIRRENDSTTNVFSSTTPAVNSPSHVGTPTVSTFDSYSAPMATGQIVGSFSTEESSESVSSSQRKTSSSSADATDTVTFAYRNQSPKRSVRRMARPHSRPVEVQPCTIPRDVTSKHSREVFTRTGNTETDTDKGYRAQTTPKATNLSSSSSLTHEQPERDITMSVSRTHKPRDAQQAVGTVKQTQQDKPQTFAQRHRDRQTTPRVRTRTVPECHRESNQVQTFQAKQHQEDKDRITQRRTRMPRTASSSSGDSETATPVRYEQRQHVPHQIVSRDYVQSAAQATDSLLNEILLACRFDPRQSNHPVQAGGWSFQGEEREVLILRKEHQTHPVHSFMGIGIVRAPAKAVYDILRNPSTRYLYDRMLKKMKVVEKLSENLQIVYMLHETAHCFLKQSRDVCVVQQDSIKNDKYIVVATSVHHPRCPATEGAIRAEVVCAGSVIEPIIIDGRECAKVYYLTQVDLHGDLPMRLLNLIARRQPLCIAYMRSYIEIGQ
ncbi:serine-rich adhesin for platelets-like [Ptychodera flava]|uniref:serine-rich adhesin for platelets-like n=1 Tax=Ptychodera flava TaxID=63121 RepID=UPI003969EFCA